MKPEPFNDKAHAIVSEVLDAAEAWLVRTGKCEPPQTDDYLTMAYIKENGAFLEHAAVYLESEGRIAADLFLWALSNALKGTAKTRYIRHDRKCAIQLHWHTHIYFRNYHAILRQTYLQLLRTLPDVRAIDHNGVLKLAAATLPGVRTDIRRERRRRGADSDRLIVRDDTMNNRIRNTQIELPIVFAGNLTERTTILTHS
ncbi:hypothetical protein [uncultured Sphingopyxis sp.]|jgi:hypothetical protein|uniref:hypothetical protein n=1 Tax=uncultured Sphingopyxis sp. TaxID=310581 RepID=UPI000AA61CE5|nr:hypothetical protein [uncultured Sphingopyxis sp.]